MILSVKILEGRWICFSNRTPMPEFLLEAAGIRTLLRFTDSHKIQLLFTMHLSDYCLAILILTRRKTGSIVKAKKTESFCFRDNIWIYLEAGLLRTLWARIKISLSQTVLMPLDKNVVIGRGRKSLGKYLTFINIPLCVQTQYARECTMERALKCLPKRLSLKWLLKQSDLANISPCILWRVWHCGLLMITRNREKLTAWQWIVFLQ